MTEPQERKIDLPKVLNTVLLVGMAICLLFIFLLGAQLRYESLASDAFRKSDFPLAVERYLKALDLAKVTGRPRYLYMIGVCYYNLREDQRAMDFFYQLLTEFPESSWREMALSPMGVIQERVMGPKSSVPPTVTTKLGIARAEMKSAATKLITALKEVKSGDVGAAEIAYTAYKKAWESYNRELKAAWAEVGTRGPGSEKSLGKARDEQDAKERSER